MTNKEKFLQLVSTEDTKTIAEVRERIKNRAMLRESQHIALKVLVKLVELGWSQKDLATKLEVSPQQVSKIVSGKENLTMATQIKLQCILDIPILASYYESNMSAMEEWIVTIEKRIERIVAQSSLVSANYQTSKSIKTGHHIYTQEYYQLAL